MTVASSRANLRWALGACIPALLAVLAFAQSPKPADELPLFEDEVEVRLINLDVAVVDPKTKPPAHVPGLAKEQFRITLDGKPIDKATQERVLFEEICAGSDAPTSVIVVVDLNYLDPRARAEVARELEGMLDVDRQTAAQFKLYGLTRQTRQLTQGFTRDPEALRAAIKKLRQFAWLRDESTETRASTSDADSNPNTGQLDLTKGPGGSLSPEGDSDPAVEALSEQAGRSSTGGSGGGFDSGAFNDATIEIEQKLSRWRSATASLAAFEGVLRANQWVKGRKLVILFSTDAFSLTDRELSGETLQTIRDLAQSELSIWTVDVNAMHGSPSKSNLMALLAKESGGEYRRTSHRVFEEAVDRERCYYSFALPISATGERHIEHALSVRLDTVTYPKLWDLRVTAPERAVVWDRKELDISRRLAALLNPDDFSTPPVHVQVGFPIERDGQQIISTQVRVGLSSLTWLPDNEGQYESRLSLDAVLEREDEFGTQTACQWGAETIGAIKLRMLQPPADETAGGLVIELQCAIKRDGMYVARAVLNDLDADQSGAGRSSSYFDRRGIDDRWKVLSPRLIASFGKEFVWSPGGKSARRDRSRAVGRELRDGESVRPAETVHVDYLLCGPARSQVEREISAAIVKLDNHGNRSLLQSIPASAQQIGDPGRSDGRFCAPARLTIPDNLLEPGRYEVVVRSSAQSKDVTAESGIVGRVPISVVERR